MKCNLIYLILLFSLSSLLINCSNSSQNTIPTKDSLSVLIISSDHSIGQNRLGFAIIDNDGISINNNLKEVSIKNINSETKELINTKYEKWFTGRGVYRSNIELSEPGGYELKITTEFDLTGTALFEVKENSSTPSIGTKPQIIKTKTAFNNEEVSQISSDPNPDLSLYDISYEQSINNGLPTVVIFSTPSLCVSGTCGPLLDYVKEISEMYKQDCDFIHVEIFEDFFNKNLDDLESLTLSSPVEAWGLPTEPWIFLIDKNGFLMNKYEGFIPKDQLQNEVIFLVSNN